MKNGDHVRVAGRDGVYVFLKEVQGTATLRLALRLGGKATDEPTLAIPIDDIVSLEQRNVPCPNPSHY